MADNPTQDSITMAQLKQFVSTLPSKQKVHFYTLLAFFSLSERQQDLYPVRRQQKTKEAYYDTSLYYVSKSLWSFNMEIWTRSKPKLTNFSATPKLNSFTCIRKTFKRNTTGVKQALES